MKHDQRQISLFSYQLPAWERLPHETQLALQEALSLLLEHALHQQTSPPTPCDPQHSLTEERDV